ncbi:hypothetical protein [Wolbachia endosymbiont (group A) of Lypha dubia]|uniref:hypothetical protein n=1 Tax=Wolbachia endosymbiont (group A) of Lypha dubia TaxID=3066146 RepID=UPI00333FCDEB
MGNSTKELVNAFNLNNYGIDKVNTNFTVEGKKIVGLFASGTNTKEYLREIGEEIIKQHYGTKEVASRYYNLNCFPFVLGANPDKEDLGNGIVKVKLADSMDPAVIHNLEIHFANEFKSFVGVKVAARLQEEVKITKKEAYEWIRGTVQTGAIGSPYLYCIAFNNEYLEKRYFPRIFELFKSLYISEFNSRLENCGLKSSDFYDNKDGMLYIKNVSDKVIKSVTGYVKGRVALDFRTPGSVEFKVENCKNVLSELILEATGKFVDGYDYDDFTDEKKIKNGHSFALIPFIEENGQLKSLSFNDAGKINRVFNKEIPNGFINSNFISDIRGKTANLQFADCKEPVYAFSNKQIALLLPIIMQSPIAYNQINGRFEFAVDLENFKRRGSSRSSSTVNSPLNSPTHAGPSGLRTPPNQRRSIDSGIGESPPKPKDSGSSSGGPSSGLTELSSPTQEFPTRSQDGVLKDSPRRESEKFPVLLPVNQLDVPGTSREFLPRSHLSSSVTNPHSSECVGAAQNVQAGTSAWAQPMGAWPLPASSAEPSLWQPSRPSSWKGASESGSAWTSQPIGFLSSQSTSGNQWMPSQQLTEPGPSCSFWQKPSQVSSFMVNESSSSGCKISNELPPSNKLNNKEKELIEALLYTFNLTNYTFGDVYTNFFAKDGKIVSLLHDNVDREKYLQKVKASIIKKYYETKKEARELYDLDEFPFKLNCEEKQGKTVVANISSGALSNLKILFSQKFGKNVDAIDISAVKKVEKREKDEWVDRQLLNKDSLEEACQDCFPDEEAMKIIPIAFEEGEYVLDRSRDTCEVKLLLREQLRRFRDTSVAGKGESGDKPLTEEEEKLSKALLYWFNLNNYAVDPPHTNFIVKNGKIASLIDDSVDVKEYLQEVIDKTKEEYCVNKKEAYDLNEFPFKFLSNCEKNQETTVVANISRGALLNLKELFSQEHEGKVEIKDIDINIVKKAVKSKKDKWVNFQVREHGLSPKAAIETCYPDESALEYISITKGEGGHWIDRNYDASEVKSFREERWPAKGTSKAEKMKSEDNKDSGYSSGFVTDAENVSSKAEATTSSGYESMDCENTGRKSPKRKSPSPEDGGNPRKSPKRDSLPLSRLESLSLSSSSYQIGKC